MEEARQAEDRVEEALEAQLEMRFSHPGLLRSALTHRSYFFENGGSPHNERLEFLGDAVLGLVVTDMIFSSYPELPEGELAKLRASVVNMTVLAEAAQEVGLGDHVHLGRGEELSGGRKKTSILADAFEAVLGAVYLDQGMEKARSLVERSLGQRLTEHVQRGITQDFKTSLQELCARRMGAHPEYHIKASGPDHEKSFRAEVKVSGKVFGAGVGRSKKEAEQAAAQMALSELGVSDA